MLQSDVRTVPWMLNHIVPTAAHNKYGPMIRIGPNEVSFADPWLLKSVYGHGMPVTKTEFYEGGHFTSGAERVHNEVSYLLQAGATSSRPVPDFRINIVEEESSCRETFAQATLLELAPSIVHKISAMLEKLNETPNPSVDLYHWLHRVSLEIVCA